NNWNVVQYSVLVYMMAQVCDMEPGELVHVIADAHIYDRHIPIIQEMIQRKTYTAPKFWMNPDEKDFYELTLDGLKGEECLGAEQTKGIPSAMQEDIMNLIVNAEKTWRIGKNYELLVRIPNDMKTFRSTTMGKGVGMGRKTLESFP